MVVRGVLRDTSIGGVRDLRVYRLAYATAMEVFRRSRSFPGEERYSLTSQIRRSSRSVAANIAEGYRKRQYPAPDQPPRAAPQDLARTRNIDRGVVTIKHGRIIVEPPREVAKRTTISEEKFYEEVGSKYPAVVPRLKAFTAQLEQIGITTDFGQTSMILRWRPDEKRAWNLGTIETSGRVCISIPGQSANDVGLLNLSHGYLEQLAAVVPGAYVKKFPNPTTWYVAKGDKCITIDELLAHADGWSAAIQEFTAAASDALKDQ